MFFSLAEGKAPRAQSHSTKTCVNSLSQFTLILYGLAFSIRQFPFIFHLILVLYHSLSYLSYCFILAPVLFSVSSCLELKCCLSNLDQSNFLMILILIYTFWSKLSLDLLSFYHYWKRLAVLKLVFELRLWNFNKLLA